MEFTGKTVLITGAASGIGRAAAVAFLREGATVGINHINQSHLFAELQATHADCADRLIELEADVRNGSEVKTMVDTLIAHTGRLDVLVNNAGVSQIKPFLETTEEDWDFIINTDLKSVFLCSKAAIPYLKINHGAIVNIASELALSGRAQYGPYTAAKGGIISLTRSLAREFAPEIRVNAVAPGPTMTPMLEKEALVPGHKEDLGAIPMGRYAEAKEIAESILFLASTRASIFCGDIISPNGGAVMR
ncbi:SDR family NAD(P)-dependent oxidoreductase [Sulfuriferula nivalis]|uniref:3-oxoacyl-[acyl-carrier-protein] reductase FabG n=1 Tax=Sulfuriferula nivalis TaxID=2675298 RepID=A0A809SH67_9PROT|nr:SDR family oxidoreductase [Sulfuriferula nivalis]BBP00540.1 3-oxoacyl-[acyl-carrier-protein] reductase FabG [Sulfuriferula nivalis]